MRASSERQRRDQSGVDEYGQAFSVADLDAVDAISACRRNPLEQPQAAFIAEGAADRCERAQLRRLAGVSARPWAGLALSRTPVIWRTPA